MTATIHIGLRFRKSSARTLRNLAQRVRSGDLTGDVSVYEQAAQAAEAGEPLIVLCAHPDEAHQMAALYAMHGIARPTIDHLTQRAA